MLFSHSQTTVERTNWKSNDFLLCNKVVEQVGGLASASYSSLVMLSSFYRIMLATAYRQKLLAFFQDPQKTALLRIELASIIDWGEVFVKATCNLEGDGPLAFTC